MPLSEEAARAHTMGYITTSELEAVMVGDMGLSRKEIFNIQSKDTPVPWGTYAPLYEGRAAQVEIDKLLGLW